MWNDSHMSSTARHGNDVAVVSPTQTDEERHVWHRQLRGATCLVTATTGYRHWKNGAAHE
jgi:hypothetical protein